MANATRTSGSSSRPASPHTRIEANQRTTPIDVFATRSIQTVGQASPSPPRAKPLPPKRAASTPPETTNENCLFRPSRGAVGELAPISNSQQSWHSQQLSKKRSQYYENAFAYRETSNNARARVTKDCLVMAEVKLYCKVRFHSIKSGRFALTSH
jgi:hypothetical protein